MQHLDSQEMNQVLRDLLASLPLEELLAGLTPEERVAGLSEEEKKALFARLQADLATPPQ